VESKTQKREKFRASEKTKRISHLAIKSYYRIKGRSLDLVFGTVKNSRRVMKVWGKSRASLSRIGDPYTILLQQRAGDSGRELLAKNVESEERGKGLYRDEKLLLLNERGEKSEDWIRGSP